MLDTIKGFMYILIQKDKDMALILCWGLLGLLCGGLLLTFGMDRWIMVGFVVALFGGIFASVGFIELVFEAGRMMFQMLSSK